MKFPKEKVRIIQLVKMYEDKEDYISIYKMKDEMLSLYEELSETNVYNSLTLSSFNLRYFDETILIGEELLKKGYESFSSTLYVLLSCLGCCDIYHALSIIRRSKILNIPDINSYLATDGANYFNILKFDSNNGDIGLALVVANFIVGLSKEISNEKEIEKEYILIRAFEVIDTLFEIGYSETSINKLTNALKMMFF